MREARGKLEKSSRTPRKLRNREEALNKERTEINNRRTIESCNFISYYIHKPIRAEREKMLSEQAKKLKNEYARKWRENNKEKVAESNRKYWEKKAQELEEKERGVVND